MKLDKFEAYIKDRSAELDRHTPPASVWTRIDQRLSNSGKNTRMIYWQAAAVLFFILSLGLMVNNFRGNNTSKLMAGNDTEFEKTEQYYFNVIEGREVLLSAYLKDYPDLASDFRKDLKELSKNYQKLKLEFEKSRSEEVLSALIKNLQLQQDLLNNQLKIIHQITEENESISI